MVTEPTLECPTDTTASIFYCRCTNGWPTIYSAATIQYVHADRNYVMPPLCRMQYVNSRTASRCHLGRQSEQKTVAEVDLSVHICMNIQHSNSASHPLPTARTPLKVESVTGAIFTTRVQQA
jgi:hypothetical protein